MLSTAPWASLTLPSCSPNYPSASRIGQVRYINIQARLRGFGVKIANFSSFFCSSIPIRDLDTKETTPNIEIWPESLGAMLEYWYIERGLLKPRGSVCSPFWILAVEWSGARPCLFWWRQRFSDSIVFSVHTRKQRFQKASFSNFSILESVIEWLRFWWSFVVWTIAVSGANQLPFPLKTD